ncbi:MAG: helix-turn-helix transcriptional regulator [Peptococcaceae bacterium]|nr:helix-turn-helix transcriptional regulator [Peptococcaceae bacterium]
MNMETCGSAAYFRSDLLEIIHLSDKPITYQDHNHVSFYTIGLVRRGQIVLKDQGVSQIYRANSSFVVAPYQVHALLLPANYDLISICVGKDLVKSLAADSLCHVFARTLAQLHLPVSDGALAAAAESLYTIKALPPDCAVFPSVQSLWSVPENHGGLRELADEAGYSLYHFIRKFKRHVGMTPHKFLMQNRVRKAQRMIERGSLLVNVAPELGFYDQSHFIKCFKSVVGFTPSQYKAFIMQAAADQSDEKSF